MAFYIPDLGTFDENSGLKTLDKLHKINYNISLLGELWKIITYKLKMQT